MKAKLSNMDSSAMSPLYKRGAAFAAGVGFSAVPTVGPFLAVLAFFTGRLDIQRADIWWWASAILLGAPLLLTGNPVPAALATSQVIAVWLIFRSATEFRKSLHDYDITRDIGAGLVMGLGITLALGLRHLGEFRFESAITTLDAIAWRTHPALFGHAILVLSVLLAVVVPSARLRVVALALGAVGVVFSGSVEAVWVWLMVAIGLKLAGRRGNRITRFGEWVLIAWMVFLVSGLGQYLGIGRTGFLTDFAPAPGEENLFRGTEIGEGDWWFPLGVSHSTKLWTLDGQERRVFTVTKESADPWSRLQQAVTLIPGRTYTISAVIGSSPDTRPGFDGWGQNDPDGPVHNLAATLEGDVLRTSTTGELAVTSSSVVQFDERWQRMFATFRYEGAAPLTWYVGVVPDRSLLTGVTAEFAEFQITESFTLLPYRPGIAPRGVTDLRNSRVPIWRDALAAIAARPILGWGPNALPASVHELSAGEALLRPVAAHAHNIFLSTWMERGVIGLVGLFGLLAMLSLRVVQQRDRAMSVVLLGVVVLNFFDSTLMSAAVIYPLAAVLGWRAVGHRKPAAHETGTASALFTRLSLAISDYLVALSAFAGAYLFVGASNPEVVEPLSLPLVLSLATAWPLVNSATGQYPGYGRPSWQELQWSVLSAVGAGILVIFFAALTGDVTQVPIGLVLVATLLSVVGSPVGRALTKHALNNFRVWGRPVIIVGHAGSADAMAAMLLEQPQLGLHPVALVDDQPPTESEGRFHIRRAVSISSVSRSANHAIVVPGKVESPAIEEILGAAGRSALGVVQVVPHLLSVPNSDVVARPLGRSLSLEVRNNLAFPHNRFIKRASDIIMVTIGGVVAFPLLAAIAVTIRLDSPGSPFYKQKRVGRDGEYFYVWKFRSMVIDADEQLKQILATDPAAKREWEETQKLVNDPRVTRVGRLLRKTSLDELPQLWNVVRGEMSLVGPRPIVTEEIEKYEDDYQYYTQVRPGMTGAWQVSGRSDTSYEFRVELDTYYVRNWNLWIDLDILIKTVGVVLKREGAY